MQRGGRAAWNEDDWNAAREVFDRLMRLVEPEPAFLRRPSRSAKPRAADGMNAKPEPRNGF